MKGDKYVTDFILGHYTTISAHITFTNICLEDEFNIIYLNKSVTVAIDAVNMKKIRRIQVCYLSVT